MTSQERIAESNGKNTVDDLLVWNNYINLVVCYVMELLFVVDNFDMAI